MAVFPPVQRAALLVLKVILTIGVSFGWGIVVEDSDWCLSVGIDQW